MDWKSLITQIALIALGSHPKTAKIVPHVVRGIQIAEDLKHGHGAQAKLAHAVDLIREGIATENTLRPGTINEDIADEMLTTGVSAVVDAANVFKKAGLLVEHVPPTS